MDDVSEIVLESSVVIYTGGLDKMGRPLLIFPTDVADLVDIYASASIVHLMKAYTCLFKEKVAILADLRKDWTEDCINKLVVILDDLQATTNGRISLVYFIEPHFTNGKKILKRQWSKCLTISKADPEYKVKRLESLEILYKYIDKSQLTPDYGGNMSYSHTAVIDFQKTYSSVLRRAMDSLQFILQQKHQAKLLAEKHQNVKMPDVKEVSQRISSYTENIKQDDITLVISTCEDTLEKLEHPQFDPTLMQVQDKLLTNTAERIREVLKRIFEETNKVSEIHGSIKKLCLQHKKLYESQTNSKEILETIQLVQLQLVGLPFIGSTLAEAQLNRRHFVDHVLGPSQDIMECVVTVLDDLNIGQGSTSNVFNACFDTANKLVDVVQPFTEQINQLNETYTRVHLFFIIYHKTQRWKLHVVRLLNTHLIPYLQRQNFFLENIKDNSSYFTDNDKRRGKMTDSDENLDKNSLADNIIAVPKRFNLPSTWKSLLEIFRRKHSSPRKKHLRLLTKFVPNGIAAQIKNDAATLAERALFLQAVLKKDHAKTDDMVAIYSWSDTRQGLTQVVSYV